MNFSTSPPKAWTRAGDAVEPGVERRDDRRRGIALGQGGEAAQIGEQQRRLDGLADAAPQGAGEHPRRAAPAEIGLERRGQRGARGQRGERRGGEARGLAEPAGLVGGERTRPDPAERGPSGLGPTASSCAGPPPRPASQRRPASPGGPGAPSASPAAAESQRLDHLAAIGPPEPGAPGDERVRRGQRQRAAGERQRRPRSAARRGRPGKGRRPAMRRPRRRARRASKRAAWVDHAAGLGSVVISASAGRLWRTSIR